MTQNSPASHPLIDVHCHLDDQAFDPDRAEVLARATNVGVKAIVIPGVTAKGWPAISQLTESHPQLFANYGLHPLFIQHHHEDHLTQLDLLLTQDPFAIAVGECGLDYRHNDSDKATQKHYFATQLQIAKQHDLPVVIHARGAVEDSILAIKDSGHRSGIVHSYNGSYEQARRLIDLGYSFSFGGAITYTRATKLRRLIPRLPLDSLLLETDGPFQPDAGLASNGRSEPARIGVVLDTIVALRSESKNLVAQQTTENASRIFGKLRTERILSTEPKTD